MYHYTILAHKGILFFEHHCFTKFQGEHCQWGMLNTWDDTR